MYTLPGNNHKTISVTIDPGKFMIYDSRLAIADGGNNNMPKLNRFLGTSDNFPFTHLTFNTFIMSRSNARNMKKSDNLSTLLQYQN